MRRNTNKQIRKDNKKGRLFALETLEGKPFDAKLERQLNKGREFMSKYRDTFRALAK